MKDRLIDVKELANTGAWLGDREILPPISETTQAQLRTKRKIKFRKLAGRVYYHLSALIDYSESQEVNIVKNQEVNIA